MRLLFSVLIKSNFQHNFPDLVNICCKFMTGLMWCSSAICKQHLFSSRVTVFYVLTANSPGFNKYIFLLAVRIENITFPNDSTNIFLLGGCFPPSLPCVETLFSSHSEIMQDDLLNMQTASWWSQATVKEKEDILESIMWSVLSLEQIYSIYISSRQISCEYQSTDLWQVTPTSTTSLLASTQSQTRQHSTHLPAT